MDLNRVRIQHYRSIDDVTIEIVERCLILLGINESGKSNILRMISAISPDFTFDFNEDSKIPVDGEYKFKEPNIMYTFKLIDEEVREILDDFFDEGEYKNWPIVYNSAIFKSLKQFLNEFVSEVNYTITLTKDNQKNISSDFHFLENALAIKDDYYFTLSAFEHSDLGKVNTYKSGEIINISMTSAAELINQNLIKRLEIEDIHDNIRHYFDELINKNIPKITYWNYDKKYLLTDPISIDDFKINPDISIPLRNIFRLAGITDIQETIDRHSSNTSAFFNLKKKLSEEATSHLKRVWKEKEYKDVEILVNESNGKFMVQVKDATNLYNFSQRSDGFKRFISFLLMLSAEYKTNKLLENSILIFDEPDISLHPSGTRHLLKEIIELSKKNYAIVASHSIFFIDRTNIKRHVIVSKEGENTTIKQASYQNFTEEEVLFQALGCSLFDILKQNNLCFEGWTDKEIFKILSELFEEEDISGIKEFVNNHGILWSSSASKIYTTLMPFVGSGRRFYAIADEDGAGKKEKENFDEDFRNTTSKYFTYKDLSKRQMTQMTLEDLLPEKLMIDFFNEHLNEILSGTADPLFLPEKLAMKNGIIYTWEAFCSKEYKPLKDKLINGYKNKIPATISKFISEYPGDKDKLKKEFSFYKTFIEALIENSNIPAAVSIAM